MYRVPCNIEWFFWKLRSKNKSIDLFYWYKLWRPMQYIVDKLCSLHDNYYFDFGFCVFNMSRGPWRPRRLFYFIFSVSKFYARVSFLGKQIYFKKLHLINRNLRCFICLTSLQLFPRLPHWLTDVLWYVKIHGVPAFLVSVRGATLKIWGKVGHMTQKYWVVTK